MSFLASDVTYVWSYYYRRRIVGVIELSSDWGT